MFEEIVLEFLRSNDNPVATTELAIAMDAGEDRSGLYDMLVGLERKGLVARSHGVEANGHTLCFNWTTP